MAATPPNHEETQFWRIPEYANLELLRARYIKHRYTLHTHDTFAIGVITYGSEVFQRGRRLWTGYPGQIVIVNPGEVHDGYGGDERGWMYNVFYPASSLLVQASADIAGVDTDSANTAWLPYFPQGVIQDAYLFDLMLRLHQTLAQSPARLERDARFLWTMAQLVSRHAAQSITGKTPGQESQPMQRARDYIQQNYAENITLKELAAVSGLSPYHFLRVFRRDVGLTPHAYLNHVRVLRARALLQRGYPIAQAAVNVGFVDQSHLHRHFKRIVGVTPGQYALTAAGFGLSV
jgi:AraC-like DNA-binding protein